MKKITYLRISNRDVDTTAVTRGSISITFELFVLYVLNIFTMNKRFKIFRIQKAICKNKKRFYKVNFFAEVSNTKQNRKKSNYSFVRETWPSSPVFDLKNIRRIFRKTRILILSKVDVFKIIIFLSLYRNTHLAGLITLWNRYKSIGYIIVLIDNKFETKGVTSHEAKSFNSIQKTH